MFRELDALELEAVTGGWLENPTAHGDGHIIPTADGYFMMCGPLADGYVRCGGDTIVVNGSWDTVSLGNGVELRMFSDGGTGYYKDGVYMADVEIVDIEAVDGESEFDLTVNEGGVDFSYTSNDSQKYYFKVVPMPQN